MPAARPLLLTPVATILFNGCLLHMDVRGSFCFSLGLLIIFPCSVLAQWASVAPGIDYQEYTVSGPNNVFVSRMDRDNLNVFIESSIAQGRLSGGAETVSGMASRYDDAIGYWGEEWGTRNDVVVAINGDFFTSGVPTKGQIHSGWYAKRFPNFTIGTVCSGFTWRLNRDVFIGECVNHVSNKNIIAYPATGATQNFTRIGEPPATDKLALYTPQFGSQTDTDNTVSEVVVEMNEPTLIKPLSSYVSGVVREIRPNQGGATIPFDSIVLSGDGGGASKLLANVSIGSEVRVSQEIKHYMRDCSTNNPHDYTKSYAAVGGSYHFLEDGVERLWTTSREPRTAVAYNADYVYFIVVDGRSASSVGMTIAELTSFCLTSLSATDGVNQDGGGSSAMWVNGVIKNVPSDGSERAVANGLMMAVLQPKNVSLLYLSEDAVSLSATADVRLGPGTNYSVAASLASGTTGTIANHPLAGVYAKGSCWWKCEFATATGWVNEAALALDQYRSPDFDGDGDVDLADYGHLQKCYTGTDVPQGDTGCLDSRLDGDSDIDQDDFGIFVGCFSPPRVAYDPACLEPGT